MTKTLRSFVAPSLIAAVTSAMLGTTGASSAENAGAPSAPFNETVEIRITDEGLEPRSVSSVLKELEVVWVNESSLPRRVTEPTFELFDSGRLLPGDTFSFRPHVAGTFAYTADVDPSVGLESFQADGELRIAPAPGVRQNRRNRFGQIVRWSLRGKPLEIQTGSALTFDVKRGSSRDIASEIPKRWRWWHRGTRRTSGWIEMECDMSYFAKVRVRDVGSGGTSGWSPPSPPMWTCVSDRFHGGS